MKTTYSFIPSALISLVLIAGISGCNEKKATDAGLAPRPVMAMAVKYEPKNTVRSFVGVVRPRVESDLGFRVSGKVEKRAVQVGDRVKAGQELAELDASDLYLQRQQADAELDSALSSQRQANAAYNRGVILRKQGWTTAADLDRLKAVSDEANGRMLRAKQAVSLANNTLGYAILLADSDGVVTSTMIEAGQIVAAGAPAIRVAQSGAREVVVAIPEAMVETVAKSSASISLWNRGERRFGAKLRELSPSADSSTRTYQAKFTLIDEQPKKVETIKTEIDKTEISKAEIGMTATLTLSDADTEKFARLPLSSLFNDGKGTSLWVIDTKTGALSLKPVVVAGYDAQNALIKSGVDDGEMVVTLGVQKLDAGQKVRIVANVF